MARQLVKTETGKLHILVDGVLCISLQCDFSYRITSDNRIDLIDTAGQKASLFADDLTTIQVAPAAPVPFSGDAQDLANELDALSPLNLPNAPYGEIWGEDETANVSLPTMSVYVLYDKFNALGENNRVTPDLVTARLTAQIAGRYLVSYSGTAAGIAGESYDWEIHKNGFRTLFRPKTCVSFVSETAVNIAGSGIVNLGVGDFVDLRVRCITTAPTTIKGPDMDLNMVRIGA